MSKEKLKVLYDLREREERGILPPVLLKYDPV